MSPRLLAFALGLSLSFLTFARVAATPAGAAEAPALFAPLR